MLPVQLYAAKLAPEKRADLLAPATVLARTAHAFQQNCVSGGKFPHAPGVPLIEISLPCSPKQPGLRPNLRNFEASSPAKRDGKRISKNRVGALEFAGTGIGYQTRCIRDVSNWSVRGICHLMRLKNIQDTKAGSVAAPGWRAISSIADASAYIDGVKIPASPINRELAQSPSALEVDPPY